MPTEVAVALVTTLGGIIVVLIQTQRTMRRQVAEVHESTVNSHGTDLRHDVDRALGQGDRTLEHLTTMQSTQARILLTMTDVRAEQERQRGEQERQHRTLADHLEVTAKRDERLDALETALAGISEALPIIARSTPPDPEEQP